MFKYTQEEKEDYIANMVIYTLFVNNVHISECYRILDRAKQKLVKDYDN